MKQKNWLETKELVGNKRIGWIDICIRPIDEDTDIQMQIDTYIHGWIWIWMDQKEKESYLSFIINFL